MTELITPLPIWHPTASLLELHQSWLAPVSLRGQLIADGMSDKAIKRQVAGGTLAKVRWGAYCGGASFAELDSRGRHGLAARAVMMQSSVDVVLSHCSALIWYGAPEWGLDFSVVHVTRPDGRAGRREAGVCQHRGEILKGDVVMVHGIAMMSPTRALLELTTIADLETCLVHVNHLLRTGQTTIEQLWDRYAKMKNWPSTLHTELVLRLADGRIESVLESRFYAMCWRNRLPMPEPQYVVTDLAGVLVARLDFAWPKLKKWAECDGKVKYEKHLKPGERASDVVVREKERDKLVTRLTGMQGERFVWADVENEARTVARLRDFLLS